MRLRLVSLALLAAVTVAGLSLVRSNDGRAAGTCATPPDVVTHGPRIGATTDTTSKIWARTCAQADVAVEYKLEAQDWSEAQQTAAMATDASADNTVVIELTGLSASTRYNVRLLVDGQVPGKAASGSFKTLVPLGEPSAFSFIVASDMHHPFEPGPAQIMAHLLTANADFGVFMGDQYIIEIVMNNLGRCCTPESQADYELGYRDAWAYQPWRDVMTSMPTMITWDDHEILNDWDAGTSGVYAWARAAFEEYAGSANPEPRTASGVQYLFGSGEVEVYVLDTRTYRSPGEEPDGPGKTMLGAEQKADLKGWLLTSDARFKIIASSVMWTDYSRHTVYGESWPVFATERNELFDFIADNKIAGVMLFSGDEHWAGVFKMEPWGIYEVAPAPLSVKVGAGDSSSPEVLFSLGSTRTYGLVSVDTEACPATITVRLKDHNNVTRYTLPLDEIDLGADRDEDLLAPCQEEALGTDPDNPDTDGDGCWDGVEIGGNASQGGLRDPTNPWDFYDTNGNRRVRVDDIVAVVSRFGIDADEPGYTTATDRSRTGPGATDLGPPDGMHRVEDIASVVRQFGHTCV